ncbi:MAG: DUF371 domain-containing protein [Candidatus Methanosuratus sp.]|nr:DUF371 domain-containing protein [Candidatus Methanosuratincola sp.]
MPRLTFLAEGDCKITAKHQTTLEITREELRTKKGDCIIATRSAIGLADLPEDMKRALRTDGAKVTLWIEAGGISDAVKGRGSSKLTLESETDMVARKSAYVCGRTLMVNSDKSASEIRRDLVRLIAKDGAEIKLTIEVKISGT